MTLNKDKTIVDLVEALHIDEKGWCVKDHWDGDMCAIGIASKSQPDRLVYVSTFAMPSGRYYCECEVEKGDSDLPYSVVDSAENVDIAGLEKKMIGHLGVDVPPQSGQRRQAPAKV